MKDERGVYYYPNPAMKTTRMYVRRNDDGHLEFRLWSSENEIIWEQHQWIPLEVIREAIKKYKEMGNESNPSVLYDEQVANALLDEEARR